MRPLSLQGRALLDRRRFLQNMGTTLGGMSLLHLLQRDGLLGADIAAEPKFDPVRPYAPRAPHFTPRAKQLLIIYCVGAVSQLDSFDYKPELFARDGQVPPNAPAVTFEGPIGKLAKPRWEFQPRGECGKMVSNLFPCLAELADEMCFIHSLTAKSSAHTQAENFMSTGFTLEGHPSLGAWSTYALGSENQNLPSFVAIPDPRGRPQAGYNNWGPGYLPAAFQGTAFTSTQPLRNLTPPPDINRRADVAARDLLSLLNERHLEQYPGDTDLSARIASYELAGQMQLSIPEINDLSQESARTISDYGADATDQTKSAFARNCLLARRLLERGVRVVQLFNGGSGDGGRTNWDSHADIFKNHGTHAAIFDQPVAALLRDLKQRGLLDSTLVVGCTEFGRLPFMQANGTGRDHNIDGFTCWLAGAGVKRGFSFGKTDELGWKVVENQVTVYDFNATILHLMGLDHERLTYYHNGIERRLTDVHGDIIEGILA